MGTTIRSDMHHVLLVPSGAGEPQEYPIRGLEPNAEIVPYSFSWTHDGKSVCLSASVPGHGPRVYLLNFSDGAAHPVSPEGFRSLMISPDGSRVAALDSAGYLVSVPVNGGPPHSIPDLPARTRIGGWTRDSRELYTYNPGRCRG